MLETAFNQTVDEVRRTLHAPRALQAAIYILKVFNVPVESIKRPYSAARRCWGTMAPTRIAACRRRRWPRRGSCTAETSSLLSLVRPECTPLRPSDAAGGTCALSCCLGLVGATHPSWRPSCHDGHHAPLRGPRRLAGTPFWKLVLKQFDDLLVKVSDQLGAALLAHHAGSMGPACKRKRTAACGEVHSTAQGPLQPVRPTPAPPVRRVLTPVPGLAPCCRPQHLPATSPPDRHKHPPTSPHPHHPPPLHPPGPAASRS